MAGKCTALKSPSLDGLVWPDRQGALSLAPLWGIYGCVYWCAWVCVGASVPVCVCMCGCVHILVCAGMCGCFHMLVCVCACAVLAGFHADNALWEAPRLEYN